MENFNTWVEQTGLMVRLTQETTVYAQPFQEFLEMLENPNDFAITESGNDTN